MAMSMTDQEKCVRITRVSRKRAVDMREDCNSNKKRVVLSEVPDLTGVEIQKLKTRKKALPDLNEIPNVNENDGEIVDIDASSDDPQMCGQYVTHIYEYLRSMENEMKRRPLPNYMEKIQKDVTANMRGILVDWLSEVMDEYKLHRDTLYLTVAYIDRYMSLCVVNRQKLQLLGVASMLIASKYEEITPPNVKDFCYITEYTYTKEDVVQMEANILNVLKFEMGSPTVQTFLRRFTRVAQEDQSEISSMQLEYLGHYLADLSLLDYNCVKFVPSLVAASVVFLARFIMQPNKHPWTISLQQYTKYEAVELKECVVIIHDLYMSRRGRCLQAVREKYKQPEVKCVALIPSLPEVPLSCFKMLKNEEDDEEE